MDIRPVIIICLFFLGGIIIIGFILPAKFQFIKYLCWGISGIILVFAFIVTPLNIYYNKKEEAFLFGTYKLDMKKSKFHNINLSQFNELTFTIKSDYTFTINQTAPFFVCDSGTWLYWIDGDEEIIKCKFKNAERVYPIVRTDSDLIFQRNILYKGVSGDKIAFKHK